jgi:hypothetical protein
VVTLHAGHKPGRLRQRVFLIHNPNETPPQSALACSVTTAIAKAQPLIEQGAAESFFFGSVSFLRKKRNEHPQA